MKTTFLSALLVLLSLSSFAHAEVFKVPLTNADQTRLAQEMSKLDFKYKTEETINENSSSYILKKYEFLNETKAFFINCSEKFYLASTVGVDQKCEMGFNYALSDIDSLSTHDGFMENFAIAEIKNADLARDLYKTIGNGLSPSVFFNSSEKLIFTHPTTGKTFPAFRLRIDCKRDASYKSFECVVASVK